MRIGIWERNEGLREVILEGLRAAGAEPPVLEAGAHPADFSGELDLLVISPEAVGWAGAGQIHAGSTGFFLSSPLCMGCFKEVSITFCIMSRTRLPRTLTRLSLICFPFLSSRLRLCHSVPSACALPSFHPALQMKSPLQFRLHTSVTPLNGDK